MIHCLLAKGPIVIFSWLPSLYGLFGNEGVDRIAKHGAFGNALSQIDIPLSTQDLFNILENRMKTDLNLSISPYLSIKFKTFIVLYCSLIANAPFCTHALIDK